MTDYVIEDSGNRQEFKTGSQRDDASGKMRVDLSGWEIVEDMCSMLTDRYVTRGEFEEHVNAGRYEDAMGVFLRMWLTRELRTKLAWHMGRGAEKYGDKNWQLGQPEDRYKQSALRHFWQWFNGLNQDEDHAAATMFNLFAPYWTRQNLPREGADNE